MKITELLEERQELDELSMSQVGSAIGKGATALGKGIGATASGTVQAGKNFMKGLKHGWQTGRVAVAGDDAAAADLAQPTAGPGAGQAATAAPAAGGNAAPSGQPAAGGTPAPTTAGPTAGQGQTAAPAAAGQGGAGGGAATANPAVIALKQQIDKLDPASKKQLYTALAPKGGNAQANTAQPGAAQGKSGSGIIGSTIKKGVDALSKQMSKTPLPQKSDRRDFETPGSGGAATNTPTAPEFAPIDEIPPDPLMPDWVKGGTSQKPAPERKPGASPAAGGTGFGYDGDTGLPFNSQAEREAGLAKQKAAAAAGKTMADAPVSASNTAKPGNPNLKTAEPAAAPSAGAGAFGQMAGALTKGAPAADPAASEPAAGKPSPEQIKQAQLKKDLLKKQQARAGGATQPSGFAASGVGQARQRIGVGKGGEPISYTVREDVEFYSKFLGKMI